MDRLAGKVAIVTGAGAGLGRAYALALAKEGAAIVVNDVVVDRADSVVEEIKKAGGKAVSCSGGVGNTETANNMVATALKEFGKLDILVNNAGIARDSLIKNMTEDQWDAVINVHLKGTFLNTQAAVIYFIQNSVKGKIINITSAGGLFGKGFSNYCAAKAGIIGLTLSNARELANNGICVNAIAPMAKTDITECLPEKYRTALYKQMTQESTIGRVGEPEDVVPIVIFLASDESAFMTGQVMSVSGNTGIM